MLVEDIMNRKVITAKPEESVEVVSRRLVEEGISGLPVVDEAGKVVGIVSEGDLIRKAQKVKVPAALEILGGVFFLESPGHFYEELRRAAAVSVGDLMTREVISATPRTTLEEAATMMVQRNINRLPVVEDDGRLVGIVTRQDLMRGMHEDEPKGEVD